MDHLRNSLLGSTEASRKVLAKYLLFYLQPRTSNYGFMTSPHSKVRLESDLVSRHWIDFFRLYDALCSCCSSKFTSKFVRAASSCRVNRKVESHDLSLPLARVMHSPQPGVTYGNSVQLYHEVILCDTRSSECLLVAAWSIALVLAALRSKSFIRHKYLDAAPLRLERSSFPFF